MSDSEKNWVDDLSPKQKELLELLLHEKRSRRAAAQMIPRRSRDSALPLSFAQRRLWFVQQYMPDSPVYNVVAAYRMEGNLDHNLLERSLSAVIDRHEVLRCRISAPDGEPVQRFEPEAPVRIEFTDLREAKQPANDALRGAAELGRRAFDLDNESPVRAQVWRIAEAEYLFGLVLHHIVADGWSMGLILQELSDFYAAGIRRDEPTKARLPFQFGDYAAWQHDQLAGNRFESDLAYWRSQLAGADKLRLNTDFPRKATPSHHGLRIERVLEEDVVAKLRRIADEEQSTFFNVTYALFGELLHRYTRQEDVVIGIPTSGRMRPEVESLVGMFINMLALRVDVSGKPTLRELVRRASKVSLDAQSHQDLPFEAVVEALNPGRDPSYNPLFQVMFAVQNSPLEPLRLPGLKAYPVEVGTETSKVDLTLEIYEIAGKHTCILEFNTDLFEISSGERILEHYCRLLAGAVAAPDQPLANVLLLTGSEQQVIVQEWNRTEFPVDVSRPISRMVEDRAAEFPGNIALRSAEREITYSSMNSTANRLARHLRSLGAKPDSLVGVCLKRSPEMVVALLSVLKAGAAYVPLDPEYPPDRLAYTLRDAGVKILLTHSELSSTTAEFAGTRAFVDKPWGSETYDDSNLPDAPGPKQLAYVIYTSGSTGRPKGVEIEHGGLVNFVNWHCRRYDVTPNDRAAQVASPGFDASVWEIWPHLAAGASVHFCAEELRFSPERLLQWMADESITLSFVTTALAVAMLAQRIPANIRLKALLTGGEKMHRSPGQFPFELVNHYGPTENTVASTLTTVAPDCVGAPTIGRPLDNVRVYILDEQRRAVPIGMPGEIYLGGMGVARGYHNRPDLTVERFVADPFLPGERLYKTGDLARFRSNGEIEFIGRVDEQVKLRGFRVEPGEVESVLTEYPGIKEAAVIVSDRNGDLILAAYIAPVNGNRVDLAEVRAFLKKKLPYYMVPAAITVLEKLPLNPSGKVDRKALPQPIFESEPGTQKQAPLSATETLITGIWKDLLKVGEIGRDDNFFDLGGHSLLLTKVHKRLERELGIAFSIVNLFAHPTVRALANFLEGNREMPKPVTPEANEAAVDSGRAGAYEPIAIIGMAGRFPGADSVDELWRFVSEGKEAIRQYTDAELREAGVDSKFLENPNYVKAGTCLEKPEWFDAKFFGMSAREADITDPQHRLLLECAHAALESAACDPQTFAGRIGVFVGAGISSYFLHNVYTNPSALEAVGPFQALLGMDKDFAATRISYKLNLRGPSFSVQTACSTSLVAVHLACQSLLEGACEVALAGGASVFFPQRQGYFYQEEGILSPDGHCRAFDAQAQGTVPSNGVAVVVLKRLRDARRDGDHIHAVIRGSAINNDGSLKVGYTAPSVEGQCQVIRAAQSAAGVSPQDITYVETHGTGTALGDPIEIEALTRAFSTDERQFCALSSLKSNLGHLDAAAGVAGLIKATVALEHRQLPPTVHYESPNPKIPFSVSPFFVNDKLRDWIVPEGRTRRAGVSSFGIGGTNAHVVLEEAPVLEETTPSRPVQLVTLSGKSPAALAKSTENLATFLSNNSALNLADVAYTLHCGRTAHRYRAALVGRDSSSAAAGLLHQRRVISSPTAADTRPVAFMFPGQGCQYPGMAKSLYQHEQVFREAVDACAELFQPELGIDLRTLVFGDARDEQVRRQLDQTWVTQPALFAIEYALSRWWMHIGLEPAGMIGHSIGEYVAAAVASVWTLEDAVRIVALRGQLMQRMASGAMLAINAAVEAVTKIIPEGLAVAAVNGPKACVVSGHEALVSSFERMLTGKFEYRRLHTSHAFHSAMMQPAADEFESRLAEFKFNEPRRRFISNVTGTWINAQQVTSPRYWSSHLRNCVQFADGIAEIANSGAILVEVGPGNTLSSLARQGVTAGLTTISTLPSARQAEDDLEFATNALGRAWVLGCKVDWQAYHAAERRHRVVLPTYPFERQRHWIEPGKEVVDAGRSSKPGKQKDIEQWFYLPSWERAPLSLGPADQRRQNWVVCTDGSACATQLISQLQKEGNAVLQLFAGDRMSTDAGSFSVRADRFEDLSHALHQLPDEPSTFVHFWSGLASTLGPRIGFDTLLNLAKAEMAVRPGKQDRFVVVTSGLRDVTGTETVEPEQAAVLGLVASLGVELQGASAVSVDIDRDDCALASWIIMESSNAQNDSVVAYRGKHRWVRTWRSQQLSAVSDNAWIEDGSYLITGGTGGVGLQLARMLASERKAKVALVARHPLPARAQWDKIAASGGPDAVKVRALLDVERSAADFLLLSADVSDATQMESVFQETKRCFGRVDVVIHASGERVSGTVEQMHAPDCDRQFAAKLSGTRNIGELAERHGVSHVVAISSIASSLGVYGHAAYAAAHAVLDAFGLQSRTMTRWTTVNLDNWLTNETIADVENERVMTPAEGREVFRRVLRSVPDQVFVSTEPPVYRMQRASLVSNAGKEAEPQKTSAHPRPALSARFVAPTTDLERSVARIWQDILGTDEVGMDDNFFELGGDSVMALQLVARVRPLGLTLSPKLVFEAPTIAELLVRLSAKHETNVQKPGNGPVRLTPIQSWFFQQDFPDKNHFNHALMLIVDRECNRDRLFSAIREIAVNHTALRLRFHETNNIWTQTLDEREICVEQVELAGVPDSELRSAISAAAERVQNSLNIEQGPVFRALYFDCGKGRDSRLLLTAHHLIVDLTSWQILLDDVTAALHGGIRSASDYRGWAEQIAQFAESGEFNNEVSYWADRLSAISPIEPDFSSVGRVDEAGAEVVTVTYQQTATTKLLHATARAHSCQPRHLILAALNISLSSRCSGALVVDVEGIGREPLVAGTDVSRTIGWFTSLYPVMLANNRAVPLDVLHAVRDELDAVPHDGVGYGALRYILRNPKLHGCATPEVLFLFHGRRDLAAQAEGPLRISDEDCGRMVSPRNALTHKLIISAAIHDDALRFEWKFSPALFRRRTIEELAEVMCAALDSLNATAPRAIGGAARISAQDFQKVLSRMQSAK